jgi:hypothetical protein
MEEAESPPARQERSSECSDEASFTISMEKACVREMATENRSGSWSGNQAESTQTSTAPELVPVVVNLVN